MESKSNFQSNIHVIIFSVFIFFVYLLNLVQMVYMPIALQLKGFSIQQIGMLLGIFFTGSIICPIIINQFFSHITNYKNFLMVMYLSIMLLRTFLFFSHTFTINIIIMFIFSIAYGLLIPLSDIVLMNCVPDSQHYYGKIRIWGTTSFFLGSVFLSIFPHIMDITSLFYLYRGVMVVALLGFTVVLCIPSQYFEFYKSEEDTGLDDNTDIIKGSFNTLKLIPTHYWIFLLIASCAIIAINATSGYLTLAIKDTFYFKRVSMIPMISAGVGIIGFGVSNKIIKNKGVITCTLIFLFFIFIRLLLLSTNVLYIMLFSQTLHIFCFPLLKTLTVYISKVYLVKEVRSIALNISHSMFSMARFITSIFGGFLIAHFSYRSTFFIFSLFPLIGVVIVILILDGLLIETPSR